MSATDLTTRIAERINPQATGQMMVGQTGLAIRDMSQLLEFAKIMAIGGVSVPKHLRGSPGACIAVCLQAVEWQMSPFAVANKSYSVNDRLAYEAQLIHAVLLKRAPIKGRPKFEYLGEGQGRQCKVTAVLDDGTGTVDYTTPHLSRIPVQNSPLWKADPDQQLGYYAVRALARRHFPDVIMGVLEREEAKHSAIEGEFEEVKKPDEKQERASIDRQLDNLGIGLKDTPVDEVPNFDETDIIDSETGEVLANSPEPTEMNEFDEWPELLAAARKGTKPLNFAIGKLDDAQLQELGSNRTETLKNIAKMSSMKTGD